LSRLVAGAGGDKRSGRQPFQEYPAAYVCIVWHWHYLTLSGEAQ